MYVFCMLTAMYFVHTDAYLYLQVLLADDSELEIQVEVSNSIISY